MEDEEIKKSNKMSKDTKKRIFKILLSIAFVLLVVGGFSYAYIYFTHDSKDPTVISTGCLKVNMSESTGIDLSKSRPMSDENGLNTKPYTFTLKNTCNTIAKYNVTLNLLNGSDNGNLSKTKVALDGPNIVSPTFVSNLTIATLNQKPADVMSTYLLVSDYLEPNQTKTYDLRMWISENVTDYTGEFKTKIIVDSIADDGPKGIYKSNMLGYKILSEEIKPEETEVNTNASSITPGLYKSTKTNEATPTYYFKGNVTNNYVKFGGTGLVGKYNPDTYLFSNIEKDLTWRIIRINEDGTIRMILDDPIDSGANEVNNGGYQFNFTTNNYKYMYYSEGEVEGTSFGVEKALDDWYNTHLGSASYDSKVVPGDFCEQMKVKPDDTFKLKADVDANTVLNMANYKPSYRCLPDGNGYDLVYTNKAKTIKPKVGLISVDEAMFAGLPLSSSQGNTTSYLSKNYSWWAGSPAGFKDSLAHAWLVYYYNGLNNANVGESHGARPVINLKADTMVTGLGTESNPYVVVDSITDTTKPKVNLTVDEMTINITATDNVGIVGYAITNSPYTPSEWTEIASTTSFSKTITVDKYNTYYIHVIDNSGNTAVASEKIVAPFLLKDKVTSLTSSDGVYPSTETNGGTTYYYKGAANNYVKFGGRGTVGTYDSGTYLYSNVEKDLTWRIIRVNEDGSIRMILDDIIDVGPNEEFKYGYKFNFTTNDPMYMYYSNVDGSNGDANTGAKKYVDDWYQANIVNKGFDGKVAETNFCEQMKVRYDDTFNLNATTAGTIANKSNYVANFKCENDANGKGLLRLKVGLISIDEVLNAGLPISDSQGDSNSYLTKNCSWWTMSPAGFKSSQANVWLLYYYGGANAYEVGGGFGIRPVINLKSNVVVMGNGTSGNPYKVMP